MAKKGKENNLDPKVSFVILMGVIFFFLAGYLFIKYR